MSTISLESLRKVFGGHEVISDVSLDIADGECVAFVGPSGCGKSTLLRIIAGLEPATGGRVRIDGADVTQRGPGDRGLAMVFQTYALYPHLNVEENLGFPLKMAGTKAHVIADRVSEVAAKLNLTPLLARRPRELSGGQRQRVAIGRAIIRQPRAFLFDEPLSNLDASLRAQTRVELTRLQRSLKITTIYVTHDQVEAMTMADRVVVLNAGRVEQISIPVAIYERPANRFVAGFIGSPKMNFIEGAVAERRGAHSIGVRPEHLRVTPAAEALLQGPVVSVEHLGSDTLAYVEYSGSLLCMRQPGEQPIRVGEVVHLGAAQERIYGFDRDGTSIRLNL